MNFEFWNLKFETHSAFLLCFTLKFTVWLNFHQGTRKLSLNVDIAKSMTMSLTQSSVEFRLQSDWFHSIDRHLGIDQLDTIASLSSFQLRYGVWDRTFTVALCQLTKLKDFKRQTLSFSNMEECRRKFTTIALRCQVLPSGLLIGYSQSHHTLYVAYFRRLRLKCIQSKWVLFA